MSGRSTISELFTGLQDVLTLQGKSLQLKFYRSAAVFASAALRTLLIATVTLVALIFLSAGVAMWLGDHLGSYAQGFLLTGGFYAIVLIAVAVFSANRKTEMRSFMLKQLIGRQQDFEQLVNEEANVQAALEARKKLLQDNFNDLQNAIKKLEDRFGPLFTQKDPEKEEQGKKTSPILAGVTDLILGALLTPKASLVKGLVLPVVTKAVLNARSRKTGSGFLGKLIGRLLR